MNIRNNDAQLIEVARNIQSRAMADGNMDLVEQFWTADVTMRRALGQAITGKAEYRKMLEPDANSTSTITYQRKTTFVEVSTHWPLAYEDGRWSGYVGGVNGERVISGRYGAQWVKRDGQWLIRSEVFVALSGSTEGYKFQALP